MQADGRIDLKVLLMGAKYTGKSSVFNQYAQLTPGSWVDLKTPNTRLQSESTMP